MVMPARTSTDTVKAVRCDSLLTGTICGSSSRASSPSSIGTQMMPLVWRIMNADRLGSGKLGGHDEVALVLAILVVHDDDDASRAQLGEDLRHRIDRRDGLAGAALPGRGRTLDMTLWPDQN